MPVHHTDGAVVTDEPRLVLSVRRADECVIVAGDVVLSDEVVVGVNTTDSKRSVVVVVPDCPNPDAGSRVLLAQLGFACWAAAVWSPPEVVLHSPVPAQRRPPPALIDATAPLDYAGAPVGRQMLKHQPQASPEVHGVFHMVRNLFVQQQEVVRRTVLEVDMISDRVGNEVKLCVRHVFPSGSVRT